MLRALGKSLSWALGAAAIAALLFDGLSFAFAHGNLLVGVLFLGVHLAYAMEVVESPNFVTVFLSQFAYFGAVAFFVVVYRALVQGRRRRLEAERGATPDTSA